MKILCIIGLMVVLAFLFLGAFPLILGAIVKWEDDDLAEYTLGLVGSMIIIITFISITIVNFYFTPENFGYQEIVSENCVESEK